MALVGLSLNKDNVLIFFINSLFKANQAAEPLRVKSKGFLLCIEELPGREYKNLRKRKPGSGKGVIGP